MYTGVMTSLHLVSLHGDIDISHRGSIDEKLAPIRNFGANSVTVLDLSDVSYADSTFLHAMLRLYKHLQNQCPASNVCVVATKQIRRVFRVTGLDRLFPVFDDVPTAQQQAIATIRSA